MVHRKFQAIRGCAKIMYSDPAKKFVGASNELKKFTDSISKLELIRQGGKVGTEWRFHPPNAPHANGAVEVMVKMVKKALYFAVGDSILSFSELQTVVFEAAELVNKRPLAISSTRGNDDLSPDYICPNQLLIGRASGRIPVGSWSNMSNIARRLKYVQEITDKFCKIWYKLIFPSVVIRHKWHVEVRNLKVGDIVVTALCSEGPMFRRSYVQKVLCSEGSIFRRFYVENVLCSEIFVQTVLCLESTGDNFSVPIGHTTLDQRQ